MREGLDPEYVVASLRHSGCHLDDVIALGDANRSTLGFLPRAGYLEAASKDSILIAAIGNQLAAYCLYGLTERYVRMVHVCVAMQHRGKGLAADLVDAVQRRHPDVLGLKLKCRRDWDANTMWPRLGFQPV